MTPAELRTKVQWEIMRALRGLEKKDMASCVAAIQGVLDKYLPPPAPPEVKVLVEVNSGRIHMRVGSPRPPGGNIGGKVVPIKPRSR